MFLNISIAPASTGTVGISASEPGTIVAPASLFLEATNPTGFSLTTAPAGTPYDPAYHEITYIWTVRGSPLSAWSAPQNMVTGWNNPNVAYGKKVAFLLPSAGSYTIDLWCVDRNGVTATAEYPVTVQNPDTVYATTQTVCFSNDGGETWAGEKTGCQRATNQSELNTILNAASNPMRVLFKEGQDATGISLSAESGRRFNYVGTWGSGTRPILTGDARIRVWTTSVETQMTITGIKFFGKWDATTETGDGSADPLYFLPNRTGCFFTVYDCEFTGCDQVTITAHDNTYSQTSHMVFADNIVTNWRNYGLYHHEYPSETYNVAVIGCRLMQHVDALNGGEKNGLFNNHGPLRLSKVDDFFMSQCDVFSRNGWSPLGPDTADQPCIRINSSPEDANNRATLDRIVCEGGGAVMAMNGQNTAEIEYPGNYVLDRILAIGTAKTYETFFALEFGGTTIRNMLGILANVPRYTTNSWSAGIKLSADNVLAANYDSPVQIHNTTFLSLLDGTNDFGISWPLTTTAGSFTAKTFGNNILHAPNHDTPVNSDAPIDVATAISGVTPRYKGVRFNFGTQSGTLGSNVTSPSGTFTVAYPSGTDQAYWTALSDVKHTIMLGSSTYYYAPDGQFSVSFGASNITITNTSGSTWSSGTAWVLRLDRASQIAAMDTTYANPTTIPTGRPTTGSAAIGSASGVDAYDDFELTVRPTTGADRGAVEAA